MHRSQQVESQGLSPDHDVPGAYQVYRGLVATAVSSDPSSRPALGVWLRDRHVPVLAVSFPDVPGLIVDGWMFEGSARYATLDSVSVSGEDTLLVRHRFSAVRDVVHVTTVTAYVGVVEVTGRLELDRASNVATTPTDAQVDACLDAIHDTTAAYWPWLRGGRPRLPDLAPDLCFQLLRSPAFQTAPLDIPRNSAVHAPYLHRFATRCSVFTRRGHTHLSAIPRTEIASKHPDIDAADPRNTPPVAQLYFPESAAPHSATYCNATPFAAPVIAAASADGEHMVAVAGTPAEMLYQGWLDCLHCYVGWNRAAQSLHAPEWRLRLYALKHDPERLLEMVREDFPAPP